MPQYKVTVLETWYRKGWVHAKSPEEAAQIAEANEGDTVVWDEAEFLHDIDGSAEVYDREGNMVFPPTEGVQEGA